MGALAMGGAMRGLRRWALAGVLGVALAACAPPAPSPTATEGPALWRVSDGDSTLWLFGTVHVLPPDLQWMNPRIEAALDAAQVLWLETPTDADAAAEIGALAARLGVNPPGVRLSDGLDREDRTRLERVAKSLDVDPAGLEPLRPWLAAMQLSLAFISGQGHTAEAGVEQRLEQEADERGLERRYFETAEEQIGFLSGLSPEAQRQFLVATLRQIEEEGHLLVEMDEAWARGDLDALDALVSGMLREAGPATYEVMIRQRNAAWSETLDAWLQGSGEGFVGVGAAHLAGDDSLALMLANWGYSVEGPGFGDAGRAVADAPQRP